MKQNYNDDTFLARWLNNELTPEELINFEQSESFKDYEKIIAYSDKFKKPPYDKVQALKEVQHKMAQKAKVKKLFTGWAITAAASVVLLFTAYYFLNTSVQVSTNYGEQTNVTLPDGSEVVLNARSTIKYVEKNWNENRKITLEGEAYFKVKKGATFKVVSALGEVEVLGTQFDVIGNTDYFEVLCYEGKVKTESAAQETILTQGKAFRNDNNNVEEYTFSDVSPSWVQGESTFTSIPLKQVIKALEKQFNIKIEYKDVNVEQKFTGSFTHKNVKLALKTVFIPMEINYTFKNENKVILVKG